MKSPGVPGLTPEQLPGYRPALLRYARLQVRDAAVAEDLVQSTLLAALGGLAGFRGESSPATWLTGILRRQIIDHFRRSAREAPLPCGDEEDPEDAAALIDRLFARDGHWVTPPASWPDPADSHRQEAFLAVLEACLQGLAGRAGQVFALREILELEPEEICKDLGLSQSNYWVLMHRARLRLRQCVERGWLADGKD